MDMKLHLSHKKHQPKLCKCKFKQMESVNTADSNAVPPNDAHTCTRTHTHAQTHTHTHFIPELMYNIQKHRKIHIKAMHKESKCNNIQMCLRVLEI